MPKETVRDSGLGTRDSTGQKNLGTPFSREKRPEGAPSPESRGLMV
jgi:hypothetical protein